MGMIAALRQQPRHNTLRQLAGALIRFQDNLDCGSNLHIRSVLTVHHFLLLFSGFFLILIFVRTFFVIPHHVIADLLIFPGSRYIRFIGSYVVMEKRVEENTLQILILCIHPLRRPNKGAAYIRGMDTEQLVLHFKTERLGKQYRKDDNAAGISLSSCQGWDK